MANILIKDSLYWIGVNDRTTDLFEGIWPIQQEGVSYNSYFIDDDKKVVIDLSKAFKSDLFFDQIAERVDYKDIDYIIVNHVEPDHTGVLRILKRMSPNITILCTPKAKEMLKNFYNLEENIQTVQDGEELNTGQRILKFVYSPFVHWPETMMTYDITNKVLFSCDAFGSYGVLKGAIFDDECQNLDFYTQEALRYYVNIVAKFSKPVLNAIAKLGDVPVEIIAPSHGLIWRKNPQKIVELYKKWAEYAKGDNEPGVTMVYGSMYGNTEVIMHAVTEGITSEGVNVDIFDAARTHVSYILPSLWRQNAVMLGAPTYEVGLFPPVASVLEMASLKRIVNKKAAMFGSYSWSGGALKKIREIIEPLKWDLDDTYEFIGGQSPDKIEKGFEFGANFARKVKNG